MSIRRRIYISFGIILFMLLIFGFYMSQLYMTLDVHMADVNKISNTIQSLQEISISQSNYINLDDVAYADQCESSMSGISIIIDSKDIDIDEFASLQSDYIDVLAQLIDVKNYLTTSNKLVNQVEVDLLNHLDDPPNDTAVNTNDILINLMQGLNTQQRYEVNSLDYKIGNLLYLSSIIDTLESVKRTTADSDIKTYTSELILKFTSLYEMKKDMIQLRENELTLTNQLNQILSRMIDTLDDVLNNLRQTNQNIVSHVQNVYLLLFSVVFILVTIILIKLNSRISKALETLTKGTERIASGDYTQGVILEGKDEFTKFAVSINTMADKLRDAHFSIITYNNQLEEMVNAKTVELQNTKDDLENLNRKLTNEKEKYIILAMTDALTGLKNRAFLTSYIDQSIKEAKRYRHQFSIMLLDIDFFKHVNDAYGHHMGDEVLKGLAEILNIECRQSDIIARYGGEEFIIVFANTDLENACMTAERIRQKVAEAHFTDQNLHITISAGVTAYKGEDTAALIERVDALQYQAKRNGRNCIVSE